MANFHFDGLVKKGNPVGEVVAIEKFIVKLSGLQPCKLQSLVMFEDGSKGVVHQVLTDLVVVLHLGTEPLKSGMVAVVQHDGLVCKVGEDFIGRVVTTGGEPLDGKGPIAAASVWPVFNTAPELYKRRLIEDQVESGVTAIDALFPVVRGQRMALLGDSKSGKSTLATQLTINQQYTDQVVIYCLIAKRRSDVDTLLKRLEESGGLQKAIVVVATVFESLIVNYLAPYVACALAEYLWQIKGSDTIIIYDDLTAHAQAYREIALLTGVSPGRDSYPGDMFHAHSSLLERAGRLDETGKTQTAIPIIHAANGDITAFLPTNIMSITDGQWILDMATFRKGIRPALNTGLSVTRAGGVGHNKRQKQFAADSLKLLADYRQAEEYSRFGSELSADAKKTLRLGQYLYAAMSQSPTEVFPLLSQQLMFDVILNLADDETLDIPVLKDQAKQSASQIKKDEDYDQVCEQLKSAVVTKVKPTAKAETKPDKAPAEEPA